ncbi:hypothetical protein H9P43_001327 [Blastocladiella emersonii ATCC 22665]|nr:hypothetical protein H9P43_001327 [Blastocladiella emersonii ATCC 22665]
MNTHLQVGERTKLGATRPAADKDDGVVARELVVDAQARDLVVDYLVVDHEKTLCAMYGHNPVLVRALEEPEEDAMVEDSGSDDEVLVAVAENPLKRERKVSGSESVDAVVHRHGAALRSLRRRKEIKSLILEGSIETAKSLLSHHFPWSLATPIGHDTVPLCVHLDVQAFVEHVRSGDALAALRFSQQHLAAYVQQGSDAAVANAIAAAFTLMAYPDPYHSPTAALLDADRRAALAAAANGAVLRRRTSALEVVVRQLYTVAGAAGAQVQAQVV